MQPRIHSGHPNPDGIDTAYRSAAQIQNSLSANPENHTFETKHDSSGSKKKRLPFKVAAHDFGGLNCPQSTNVFWGRPCDFGSYYLRAGTRWAGQSVTLHLPYGRGYR